MKENKRNLIVVAIGNGKEKLNLANIEKTKKWALKTWLWHI